MQPTTLQSLRLNPTLTRASVAPPPTLSGDRVSLVGAPSATVVDYAGLCEVVTPDEEYRASRDPRKPDTEFLSYQPLSYAQFVDGVRDAFSTALGLEPTTESYALAAHGQQMYGIMAFRDPVLRATGNGIAVSLRSSHNKTFIPALAVGSHTFVCANGCFPRDSQIGHKHTSHMMHDRMVNGEMKLGLPSLIEQRASEARAVTVELVKAMESLRGIDCSDYRFAAYLGILQWHGYINDTLANRARRYWKACTQDTDKLYSDHGNRDLFGALQAVTGGLGGRVAPSGSFRAYGGALHVVQAIAENGGETDVIIPALPDMEVM